MFNQEILSCDYPANVDCSASASFYSANEEFGKAGKPEPSGDGGQKPQQRPQSRAGGRGQASTTTQQQVGFRINLISKFFMPKIFNLRRIKLEP